MYRRYMHTHGLRLAQEPEPLTEEFETFFDIPVLLKTAAGLRIIATIYIKPVGKALRKATASEAALSIWVGASGGATRSKIPPLDNGGWNKGPFQYTNDEGICDITANIAGNQWVRLIAEHLDSGAQVAKAVYVWENYAELESMTAPMLIRAGKKMPEDFEQPKRQAATYGVF